MKLFSIPLKVIFVGAAMILGTMAFADAPTPEVSVTKDLGNSHSYKLKVTDAPSDTGYAAEHNGTIYVLKDEPYTFNVKATEGSNYDIAIREVDASGNDNMGNVNGSQDGAGPGTTYIDITRTFATTGTKLIGRAYYFYGAGFTRAAYLLGATVDPAVQIVDVTVTIMKVELRYSSSTHWLVIEDKDSAGAGDDISSKPVQHAENIAKIEYAILPQGAMPPQEVTLEIVGTAYTQSLSLDTGVKQAEVETKNGKLKVDSNTWLPTTAADCFPADDYRLRLTVKFTPELICIREYQGTEFLTIKPLMQKLTLTPDITDGSTLCPYFDQVTIGSKRGYGLGVKYNLLDNLDDLTVEVTGGDTGGTKSLIVVASSKTKGTGLVGKWEGYDSQLSDEKFDEILNYPNEMTPGKKAPERVVKEDDGYKLTIKMSSGADSTQKQSFEIPFKVEYKSN